MTPFDIACDFILAPDRDGRQDDSAPGEQFTTAWGITQMTWAAAVAQGIVTGDLSDATPDQCKAIYRANYWNAMRCDDLNPGVALMLFNDATLTGVGHATTMLQRAVGAVPDGVIGPKTLRKVNARNPAELIDAMTLADEKYMAALRNAPTFINGWTRREEECRTKARTLLLQV